MHTAAKWIALAIAVIGTAVYFWTDAEANRTVRQGALLTVVAAVLAFAFFWLYLWTRVS